MYTLIIGNKNLSSWSLRPWLALKLAGQRFEEIQIRLDKPETRATTKDYSPAGKVPVLKIEEGGATHLVWDSLAICETLAERHPEAQLWPQDPFVRAEARAYAAEMHSGFPDLRNELSMFFARQIETPTLSAAATTQIARIIAAWESSLTRFDGGFLFGEVSIADCMYAPVVSRFVTYGIALPPAAKAYSDRMMALPAMQEWMAAAKAEVEAGWK